METETDKDFFNLADQNNTWQRIHLLKNLRQLKNSVARKNIQVTRSQILHEINDNLNKAANSDGTEIEEKLTQIMHNISSLHSDSPASNQKDKPYPNLSQSSLRTGEGNSGSGTTFLSTIELLGTLYDVSKNNEFFQHQERLMNILNKIKMKDSPDKELEHLQAEYLRLCQAKNKFNKISPV